MKTILPLLLLLLTAPLFSQTAAEEYDYLFADIMNANTYGYKGSLDHQTKKSAGRRNPAQGALLLTGCDLDAAVLGDGFFKVTDEENNVYYTRYGRLSADDDSKTLIILLQGKKYSTGIKLPESYLSCSIEQDGSVKCVRYSDDGSSTEKTIGKLQLYHLDAKNIKHCDNYLLTVFTEPEPLSETKIISRALETSNVHVRDSLIRLLFLLDKLEDSQIKSRRIKELLLLKLLDAESSAENLPAYAETFAFLERSYE